MGLSPDRNRQAAPVANRTLRNIFVPQAAIAPYLEDDEPALPFRVALVSDPDVLLEIARVRIESFRTGRRLTHRVASAAIDIEDYSENALLFAAFEKATDRVIGTMRIAFSTRGTTTMQHLAPLPGHWGEQPFGEARLLCVPRSDHSRMVLLMLCKAFFLAARIEDVDNFIIGARRSMEPFYRLLMFRDVSDPPLFFTPPNLTRAHRVMGFNVRHAESIWAAGPDMAAMRRVFFEQKHHDIALPTDGRLVNPLAGLKPPVLDGLPVTPGKIVTLAR